MIVLLDSNPPRDLTTLDFSDITTVAITGYPVTSDGAYGIQFASDLDQWTALRVKIRAEATANEQAIQDKAFKALTANDNYRAIVGPTNAQVVAQVDLLTREVSGTIRLLLGLFNTTTGT